MNKMKIFCGLVLILMSPVTESSRIYPQPQDVNWICPDIYVSCPESSTGKNIKFSAKVVLGVPATKVGFKWRVSGGTIINGQGTEEITVKGRRRKGQQVIATLELLDTPKTCSNKASCRTTIP